VVSARIGRTRRGSFSGPSPAPIARRSSACSMRAVPSSSGRRTYEIATGWGGSHPVNGAPTFVLTHDPPADYPRGPSNLTFVTDGIESAIRQAREVAGGKDNKLGGASPGQQALAAGLCDEILIHLAPYLLGGGVRLFDRLPAGIGLEKLSVSDGPYATHLRYRVNYEPLP
jgi:dihydrofolate reductase